MYVLYFKVKTYIQLRWNEFLLANGECEVKKKPQAKKVAVVIYLIVDYLFVINLVRNLIGK